MKLILHYVIVISNVVLFPQESPVIPLIHLSNVIENEVVMIHVGLMDPYGKNYSVELIVN